MKYVQISFDEDLLETIDRFAASSQLSRSAFVRQAVKNWIRQKKVRDLEDKWISRLKENSQNSVDESKPWMRYAGMIASGDSQASQKIDEIVYG